MSNTHGGQRDEDKTSRSNAGVREEAKGRSVMAKLGSLLAWQWLIIRGRMERKGQRGDWMTASRKMQFQCCN